MRVGAFVSTSQLPPRPARIAISSLLAIAIAYLVPRTFWLALKGQFDRHRKWARWTFPIWYYVSITGVLVYFFLYVWWPSVPA